MVFPVELPVAVFAGNRFLPRMDHFMSVQVFFPGKGLCALVALVRTLIVMAKDVSLQVLVPGKPCPADAAEEPAGL